MADGPLGFPRPFAEPEGWRGLNNREEQLLIEWHMDAFNLDRENAKEHVKSSKEENRIAVKDSYVSDGPGYVGPLIVLIGGAPTIYVVFGVEENELIEFDQDSAI